LFGAAALMLAACFYSGTHVNAANIASVRVCQTKKPEVLRLFGQPDTIGVLHGLQYWQWTSASNNQLCTGGLDAQWLNIVMDQSDLVVDLAFNPPDSYAPSNTCVR
jgi:outer membrane protein assembly factor BamE (lipoprotein component of BamABCDE complex)